MVDYYELYMQTEHLYLFICIYLHVGRGIYYGSYIYIYPHMIYWGSNFISCNTIKVMSSSLVTCKIAKIKNTCQKIFFP
jgi:hypothetical protein